MRALFCSIQGIAVLGNIVLSLESSESTVPETALTSHNVQLIELSLLKLCIFKKPHICLRFRNPNVYNILNRIFL
jgi:hypothetical protein